MSSEISKEAKIKKLEKSMSGAGFATIALGIMVLSLSAFCYFIISRKHGNIVGINDDWMCVLNILLFMLLPCLGIIFIMVGIQILRFLRKRKQLSID